MLIELILNNHFITFKHLFVFLGGIDWNSLHNFWLLFASSGSNYVLTCKYSLNLLGLFLPIFNWTVSFHILHTSFACSAMIPAATLKCHRRWCWVYGWSLLTVSSWLGGAVVNYCSVSRQNWNINITSLNMFVFISFDWWKITSQVFFFFSIFRWLLSISFILPRRKMREIFIIFCTLIHHLC